MANKASPPKNYMDLFSVMIWSVLSIGIAIMFSYWMIEDWHKHTFMNKIYLIIFGGMVVIMCLGSLFFNVSNVK